MKAALPNPTLDGVIISATVSSGFNAATTTGKQARMAIIDEQGNILASGNDVAWAAWRVCVEVQENFWEGHGHLVVHSAAPGQASTKKLAA